MPSRAPLWTLAAASVAAASLVACTPAPPVAEPAAAPPPRADAAVPDAPPDAGPPQAVLDAPAWVFRYKTPQRTETWTLRFAGGAALLEVQSAQGTMRYVGSATDGATLALNVSTSSAKMVLDCKREQRPMGAACNDPKGKPIDLLDCYHADFKEPMPFGPAPGVEYAADEHCNGYRLIAP